MIGFHVMIPTASRPGDHTYTLPVLAGAGLAATTLAAIDWSRASQQAVGAIGLAGLVGGSVVGGIIYSIKKFDQLKLERQKLYEDFNKDTLTHQLEVMTRQMAAADADSAEDRQKMRDSLHALRNDNQAQQAENSNLRDDLATLRAQFIEISKELRATDVALHAAHDEMRKTRLELQRTTEALVESEKDRTALRAELGALRRTQAGQGERLTKLEQGSAESFPIPKEIRDAPAPTPASQGTGAAKPSSPPNSPARPS